ncbi:MAG: hypothetical protein CMP08_03045 [Xanthomonadales bacterium]|nr:hypothetical protein [Xanthomonadales bacterium]
MAQAALIQAGQESHDHIAGIGRGQARSQAEIIRDLFTQGQQRGSCVIEHRLEYAVTDDFSVIDFTAMQHDVTNTAMLGIASQALYGMQHHLAQQFAGRRIGNMVADTASQIPHRHLRARDHGLQQTGLILEMPVDRATGDCGTPGDLLE